MNIELIIHSAVAGALKELYNIDPLNLTIQLQNTRKDFEGDYTLVVFPFLKYSKKSPGETANEIGNFIVSEIQEIESFNVIN
ncbi:MAG: arginine--tRNA ligase, partial [Prolixibacteraceae bacterium]|nr:arginine--tRNA ligase [Prolixibacteraceae bacterium]